MLSTEACVNVKSSHIFILVGPEPLIHHKVLKTVVYMNIYEHGMRNYIDKFSCLKAILLQVLKQ